MSERETVLLEALAAEVEGLQVICAQLARDNAELRERLEALTNPRESTASDSRHQARGA